MQSTHDKEQAARERLADIGDKERQLDAYRVSFRRASEAATKAETLAAIQRDHAKRMGERVNQCLRELRELKS